MKSYPIPIVAFAVAVTCALTGGSATAAGVAEPTKEVSAAGKNPKIEAINRFFAAYAAQDMEGIRSVLTENVEWSIPGHHPLSGTKRGVEEVVAFFTELGKSGFQADPMFLQADDEYVVDVHRGWTTKGRGKVDTTWALVWHFNTRGKIDRVVNLTADQHQMDAFMWANYRLAPLPERLSGARPSSE